MPYMPSASSLAIFRQHLKTFLFHLSYPDLCCFPLGSKTKLVFTSFPVGNIVPWKSEVVFPSEKLGILRAPRLPTPKYEFGNTNFPAQWNAALIFWFAPCFIAYLLLATLIIQTIMMMMMMMMICDATQSTMGVSYFVYKHGFVSSCLVSNFSMFLLPVDDLFERPLTSWKEPENADRESSFIISYYLMTGPNPTRSSINAGSLLNAGSVY